MPYVIVDPPDHPKKPAPAQADLLDRVIDTTEHHDHAVSEKATEQWNSRVFDCDLASYKKGFDAIPWRNGLRIIASTPGMAIIDSGGVQVRIVFEPAGHSSTRVVITGVDAEGRDITEIGRRPIVEILNNVDGAVRSYQRLQGLQDKRRGQQSIRPNAERLKYGRLILWTLAAAILIGIILFFSITLWITPNPTMPQAPTVEKAPTEQSQPSARPLPVRRKTRR
jgi:hypothetical protein